MAIYRNDLYDVPATAALMCPECGGQFSATPGDYFWMDDDEKFTCGECDSDSELIIILPTYGYTILKE